MGRVRNAGGQATHRAGPLKQANKRHKTGPHRSKGMVDLLTRGRVSSAGSISKKHKGQLKRCERKKQAVAERTRKMQGVLDKKRTIGGTRGAPICVALIPLSPTTNIQFTLKFLLSQCNHFATVVGQSGNATHLKLSSGKNVMLVTPSSNDIWNVLDTLKQADIALFLMPLLDEISPEGMTLLKTAKEQGLPTPFLGVTGTFAKCEEKSFLRAVGKYLPVEKIYPLMNGGQISNLLRMISVSKITIPKQWSLRASLFIENACPLPVIDPATLHQNYVNSEAKSNENLLEITGVIRRRNLNPHRPVMISGCGSFQILRVDVTPMQGPPPEKKVEETIVVESIPVVLPPRFLYDPCNIPMEEVETGVQDDNNMDSASDFDEDDEEEYEDVGTDESGDEGSQMSVEVDKGGKGGKKAKRLPKGTSDYQADWLVNSDGEAEDEIIGSDEEMGKEGESDGDEEEGSDEEGEDEMDWEEEKRQIQISKDAKVEAEFPDWIDTPLETPAKERFQRYRGLQSFKNSSWDRNENLPKEYSKIFQFQNFRHVYKVVVGEKALDDGPGYIPVGQRVTLILKPLDELSSKVGHLIGSSKPTSLVSLLRHENRMSVLNIHLNLTEVLKNKEELIFQVGYHRFTAKPILSEVSPGNKHKMLRFAQVNQSCMATIFAPIVFPTASVLAFKTSKAELVPVGSGHLFSVDPSRLVIKRVLLSGSPLKVTGRKAVVRFMFFNRDDIEWFKPVELKTRYGRRGHIKEPLGTHGHMKCVFDGQMISQDTVLMPLYKRVFPKWNYDPVVPSYSIYESYDK